MKYTRKEVYILQVDNVFRCSKNTIIVNLNWGRYSSIEILEKHSHRGVYSSGKWEFQVYKNLAQRYIFFWYITFSSVENTILVNLHRGKYSSLKKNWKNNCTEVYILVVDNSFKCRKNIWANSHRVKYSSINTHTE